MLKKWSKMSEVYENFQKVIKNVAMVLKKPPKMPEML